MAQIIDVPNYGQVEFPDDMTDDQIIAAIKKNSLGYKEKKETIDPTAGMSGTDKFLAGIGKGMVDVGRGAGQLLGLVSEKQITDNKNLEAPLMNTGAGQVGNMVGQAAVIAPAAFIPGANSYLGASLIGAGAGALTPISEGDSRAANMALGAAGGAVGQKIGNVLASKIESNVSNAATNKVLNATRDATLKQSQDAGYNIPRSLYDPTFISNRLESIAGKAATKQQAATNNQQVTNGLAKKYLGLSPDTPLDKATLEALRDTHAQAYRDAALLPAGQVGTVTNRSIGTGKSSTTPIMKSGAELVEKIKEARDVSRSAWKSFNSGNAVSPTKTLKEAKRADKLVTKLENDLEAVANQHGQSDIVKNLREARVNIAKVHTVENALNDATGDVSARTVLAQGKRLKLTDQAKQISDFAKAFPQVAKNGANVPAAGVSKVEAMMASLLAGGGGAAFGLPGIAAGGLAALPHMARPLAVNGGAPVYGSRLAASLSGKPQELLPYLGLLGGIEATQ